MNLKSQKGYSLIEIGVGVLIITILLACSTSLFNGCFKIYHAIQQRNNVVNYAVACIEECLQMSEEEYNNLMLSDETTLMHSLTAEELADIVRGMKITEEGREKLADGNYAVPLDMVYGDFYSPTTNYMRITRKIRRIPSNNSYAFDDTVLKVTALVEYTTKPQKEGVPVQAKDILSFELSTIWVTKW